MVLRVCGQVLRSPHDAEDAFQAVFLILARKARKINWHDSIANWLYGVAWRIARREAKRKSRIIERYCDMTDISDPQVESPIEIFDAEKTLYPALYQLPSKYRAPLVLCYLEGKTRSEAAVELGVSESTIKGRLERGRDLLRKKLSKSGIPALTFLTSEALANQVALSAIPKPVLTSLARASVNFSDGATKVLISSNSIVFSKGELTKMLIMSQLKLALVALFIVGVAGSGVLLAPQVGLTGNKQANVSPTDQWEELDEDQRDLLTKRHLQAIARAVHAYVDDHNGMLPPAAVPNANLAVEKRLSGLVLLLPYLGVRPSYIAEDDADWLAWHADHRRAKQIFDQIHLTKAWDDPANAEAAKSMVPEFLTPAATEFRNREGFAVSHFAFIRGSRGRDNGMFPVTDQPQIAIPDISDGTVNTLAFGKCMPKSGLGSLLGNPRLGLSIRQVSPQRRLGLVASIPVQLGSPMAMALRTFSTLHRPMHNWCMRSREEMMIRTSITKSWQSSRLRKNGWNPSQKKGVNDD